MTTKWLSCFCVALVLVLTGCGAKEQTAADKSAEHVQPEPDYITVQHILIGFKGSVQGKNITRSSLRVATMAFANPMDVSDRFKALVKSFARSSRLLLSDVDSAES